MKNLNVAVLDDKDIKFVELLVENKVPKNTSKALAFIAANGESNSRSIENGTSLRQPEVSIATKDLIMRGWISVNETKSDTTKGRPSKSYVLAKDINEIIKDIESSALDSINDTNDKIDRLKTFMSR